MDSSVSPKDEIWFVRVCHHISTGLYFPRLFPVSTHFGTDTPKMLFGIYEFRVYQRKEGRASFTCLNGTFARARSKAVRHLRNLGSTEDLGDVCVLRVSVRHLQVYWCAVQNGVLLQ